MVKQQNKQTLLVVSIFLEGFVKLNPFTKILKMHFHMIYNGFFVHQKKLIVETFF